MGYEEETFRVGCWCGQVSEGQFTLQHDNMTESVTLDIDELEDLYNLADILRNAEKVVSGEAHHNQENTLGALIDHYEALE